MSSPNDKEPGPLDKTPEERRQERLLLTLKVVSAGAGPIGSVVGAFLESRLPNLRLERIANFVECLDQRIGGIEEVLTSHEDNLAIVENLYESVRQASTSSLNDRREYLARLMAEHLSADDPDHEETALILATLGDITDYEFLHLVNFARNTPFVADKDELREFRDRHSSVLELRREHDSSPSHERDANTVQKGHHLRLAQKSLLIKKGGGDSPADFGLSDLGRLTLTRLGILRDPDAD